MALLDKLAYQTSKNTTRIYFIGESVYRDYPWPWGINLHAWVRGHETHGWNP
jgi:hypothetical protein